MFLLLIVPVVVVVAAIHRVLQLYAPSNVLIAHLRASRPTFRAAAGVGTLAFVMAWLGHGAAGRVAQDGPGWLNLIVLLLFWDAIKLGAMACLTPFRALALSARSTVAERFRARQP